MKANDSYSITNGTELTGHYADLPAAEHLALALGGASWRDLAIWSPLKELVAVVKDGELLRVGFDVSPVT